MTDKDERKQGQTSQDTRHPIDKLGINPTDIDECKDGIGCTKTEGEQCVCWYSALKLFKEKIDAEDLCCVHVSGDDDKPCGHANKIIDRVIKEMNGK